MVVGHFLYHLALFLVSCNPAIQRKKQSFGQTTMLLRTTVIPSTLSLYFPPKHLCRHCSAAPGTLRRFLSLSTTKPQPLFSTLRQLYSTSAAVESGSSSLSSGFSAARTVEPWYLSCSLPERKPLRVAVLLSGGVDSSVALRLLHAAGHSCTAFYLKIWFQVRIFLIFMIFIYKVN